MDQETRRMNPQGDGEKRRPPVRYDANGNPIPPKKRPPMRYDENGNPIPPKKRPPVRYDENGNPIPPKKRPPMRYDENGNPIPPKRRPPVRYDGNGNPVPPKKPMNESTGRVNSNTARLSGYDRVKQNEEAIFNREEHNKEKKARDQKNKQKKGSKIAGWILIGLQAVMSLVFMVLVLMLDLLPLKYVLVIGAILLILWGFSFISQKFKGARIVGMVFAVLISIVLGVGTVYLWKAHDVMDNLTQGQEYTVSDLSVVVMQSSTATGLQDLDGKLFGIQAMMDRENTEKTLADLQSRYGQGVVKAEYNGVFEQVNALYANEVDAIILNESYRALILETYPNFNSETRVLDGFSYKEKVEVKETKKEVDVVEEPFTVFISGNDAYGEVSLANGRSDVNILATVNPETKQILLTTTPRDYYVQLPFYEGCWDKLTHAGLYGIDCSIETLENLYDIQIDYYVRVNFSGFQDIVDALDGVEVYSEYAFTSTSSVHYFEAGYNYLYGEEALAFVRERYAFATGDVQRGKNQMAMIQAIINKVSSPAILTNYMDLMDSLSSCFITDMPREKIADLVKMQLDEGGSWQITSNSVNGYGNMRSTYSGGSEPLSVMDADETAVQNAKDMIKALEEGTILTNP